MVTHYPIGLWLMTSAECMGVQRVPTPQRCSSECSVYKQCILEGCGSGIQFHPNYDTGCRTNVVMYNATVQQPLSRCSMYQQCVLEGCGSGIQFHPNYDTGCRTNVVTYNATGSLSADVHCTSNAS
ncbi:hypothetical protein TNCV_4711231 [Trichonephila clavipes]|uniref:Uncharacterized protein n=1 Tax=Trichonephila clavipes TaxID=2585209 RepID=A0A8X6S1I1_TRICX|nr:hypothetical protein TNCV_4711231 [Trichonephila clavipes]